MNKRKAILLPILSTLAILAFLSFIPAASAADEPAKDHSMLQMIMEGGPLIMLIWVCIFGTSTAMVTFIIQLFLILRDEALAPQALVGSLRDNIAAGNYQEAWEICRANKAYAAKVLQSALERIGRGKEAVEIALEDGGQREATYLKTKNSYLSVIGVIAPMIGLLGTVIGMMGAFAVLGSSGVSDPRALALRIGEVLTATASGLFIAIPAFVFYYYFRNRATIVFVKADEKLKRLIEDIPFAELSGLQIGETFQPGAGGAVPGASSSHKVSKALTTNCPTCNGAIQPGMNPCPHCGTTLDWA